MHLEKFVVFVIWFYVMIYIYTTAIVEKARCGDSNMKCKEETFMKTKNNIMYAAHASFGLRFPFGVRKRKKSDARRNIRNAGAQPKRFLLPTHL